MKIYKTMRKRGLALFLALTMCLSLIQTTAFANEEAEHVHNEGGWTCAYTDPVTEPACVHEHDAACGYVEAVEEIPCVCTGTDEEGGAVHEDGCAYAPALEGAPCGHVCGDACVAVVTEGYWECTPPAGEPEDTEPKEDAEVPEEDAEAESPEEVPAEVQAFLDAVAAIPAITAENAAEVAEYVYGPVSEAYDALLGTEYEERDDVQEAVAVYIATLAVVDEALDIQSNTFETTTQNGLTIYWDSRPKYYSVENDLSAGSITKQVGDTGYYYYCPIDTAYCYYGHLVEQIIPEWYAFEPNNTDIPDILKDHAFQQSLFPNYSNIPCLRFNFTAGKPGSEAVRLGLYYNYRYPGDEGWCGTCYKDYLTIYSDLNWHQQTVAFNVTVNADYVLKYDANGGSVTLESQRQTKASTSCTFNLLTPTRDGYTFKGWAEQENYEEGDKLYQAGEEVVLTWSEGFGSTANPVTKTLYAVWEQNTTPSIDNNKVTVTKTPNTRYPLVGAHFMYTIKVENKNATLLTVTVTDKLNEKLTFVSASDGGTYDETTRTVTWTNVKVPANGSKNLTIKVSANDAGEITNEAKIEWDGGSASGNTGVEAKRKFVLNYHDHLDSDTDTAPVTNMPVPNPLEVDSTEMSYEFTISTTVPTRNGFVFKHWQWGGDPEECYAPGAKLKLTADRESFHYVSADLYAVWEKDTTTPTPPAAPVISGKEGMLRVQVVCDSTDTGHRDKKENLRLRDVQNGITEYAPGEVIKSSKDGYDWQYTVTLYKSDFATRFQHNSGNDHEYVSDTKDSVDVTFYYRDGAWDFENLKSLNPNVEIVYKENGDGNYFCNYVVYHVVPKQQPPVQTPDPEITVEKINGGFNVDPQTGNASVDYTVNITNNGDVAIYGLRLTDTLTANLTPDNGSVTFTFKDWKVGDQAIDPTSGGENDKVHVLQLLPRNEEFKTGQTVTLTYTVEIENNSDGEVEVELKNEATGASWSKAPANPAARTLSLRAANEDDEPDVTDSDSSSASTDNDAPDVTGSGSSTAGGPPGDSGTEGTLPKKYTVTYAWDLPKGADEELPASEKRPAGATITVDTTYSKDYEITVDGKTYVFSGWSVDGVTIADGKFTMPAQNVIITGTWTEREEQPPVDPLSVSAANVRVTYDGQGHPVIPTANKDGVQFSVVYKGANGVVGVPTDAGVYTAEITATLNGETASCTASVTITRRPLTVTTGSGSKYYDGTPLTNSTATVVVTGGEVPGEHITAVATGSQTVAGSSTNTYTMNWGSAKESNYTVTESLGTLTVLNRAPIIPPPPSGGGNTGGGTTIPDTQMPLDPGTTIADQDVPLAAPGLNNTDHFDYIKGYVIDGQILVRPEANITRAEVATIFFRLMTKEFREANWATENDFTDVKKGDWYNNAISTCTRAGILKGYEDGTFKPNQTISREEFAAIAARFASEEVPAGGMFKDIAGRWSEKDIERAAAMGWIKGSNGLFRPVDKITRAEVIVIVNRMLDRVPDADHMLPDMKTFADNTPDMWWYADVQEATNSHEYDRAEDGVTGIWTSLLPEQDWAALEEEWATAADANVADVAPKLGTEGEKLEEEAKEPKTTGGDDGNGEE